MSELNSRQERRGGKREGSGRPKGRVYSSKVTLTLTEPQKNKLLSLGGSRWVREKIDRE